MGHDELTDEQREKIAQMTVDAFKLTHEEFVEKYPSNE